MNVFLNSAKNKLKSIEINNETLVLLFCIFLTLTANNSFFKNIIGLKFESNINFNSIFFIFLTAVSITSINWLGFLLITPRIVTKTILTITLILSSIASYYIDKYNIYLDKSMVRNVFATDIKEAKELIDLSLFLRIFLTGIIPSYILWKIKTKEYDIKKSFKTRLKYIITALITAVLSFLSISSSIIPLMREHKELRFLITPSNYLSSAYKVIFKNAKKNTAKKIIDPKPKLVRKTDKPIALILVIGETVRAKNWGLSGYERQTTPELKKRNAINFTNVKSCGTDTETSLPCMFSIYGRRNYNENLILNTESILSLIKRAGVKVIWRENQSGSKGVADGVEYESFTNRKDPLFCNETRCYDEILSKDLNEKITSEKNDILIVLHTLGNHGPAYYQRYPDKFKKFIPTCDTAKLETCSKEQIVNTYDNAILYTDYFLSKTIDILKEIKTHKTALIYISDHGESLGEKNLYLHGIPYYIAPQEQTHVPFIIWFSENFKKDINMKCLTDKINLKLSHDNLPHTLLGIFGINSSAYDPEMDISHRCFK